MMMMAVAKMAITEVGLGSYVPGALCTREVGAKNETLFLGSWGRGGATAYTREVGKVTERQQHFRAPL